MVPGRAVVRRDERPPELPLQERPIRLPTGADDVTDHGHDIVRVVHGMKTRASLSGCKGLGFIESW
jgi:hypothetical protein